jgi:hypothetical protein
VVETGLFQVRREQLAPLFELEVAEVAEVAEDETTNPTQTVCCHGWMGGKKQQIRGFGSMSEQQRSRGKCRRRASVGRNQRETDHIKGEFAVHTERAA